MDSKELLSSTRAEFMRAYSAAITKTMPVAKERLFEAANASYSSTQQTRLLQSRVFLVDKDPMVARQMTTSMERLLNRSFQTTYNSFRKPSALDASADKLSLIDSSTFEDEVRINEVTNRFRTEAEEQLRDLNIRIALMFGQDNIKERENPFRPYLFSRGIATAFESFGLSTDLASTLIEQFSDCFASSVAGVYAEVNAHLAQQGVAAQLQLKIQKSPQSYFPTVTPLAEGEAAPSMANWGAAIAEGAMAGTRPHAAPAGPAPQASRTLASQAFASHAMASLMQAQQEEAEQEAERMQAEQEQARQVRARAGEVHAKQRVDKLMASVCGGAVGAVAANDGLGAAYAPGEAGAAAEAGESVFAPLIGEDEAGAAHGGARPAYRPASPAAAPGGAFGWLPGNQAVGSVLRKFFSNKAGTSADDGTPGGRGRDRASYLADAAGGSRGGPVGASGDAGRDLGDERGRLQGGRAAEHDTSPGPGAGPAARGQAGPARAEAGAASNGVGTNQAGIGSGVQGGQPGAGAGGAGGGRAEQGGAGGSRLVQSVQQLQRGRTPATEDMFNEQGEVRNLILEQRGALTEISQDIDEQMTIDIVAMLFEFILRDNQVPAEVRAQLGRLQFIVLKVALRDTSLLTQKGHPARMLVNRIGSISVGLKQLDPTGAHITTEIVRIVETLLQDEDESAHLFARMLDEFDAFIALELRAGDKSIERAVEVVEQVQNRTLRFAHTAAQLGEALHGLTIDPYLQQFLENSWVAAIEMAERDDAHKARRYRLLVPDLLWSIVPKSNEDERGHLFALLPIILNTLREGLALIDTDADTSRTLMNWLVGAHTSALRPAQPGLHAASLPSIHEHFRQFVDNPEADGPAEIDYQRVAQNHQLMNQAIKALDLEVQMLDQVFEEAFPSDAEEPESARPEVDLSQDEVEARLRSGVAVEINLGSQPSQGRLNWINPNLSNLVLSLEGQDKPSMISVRMFLRMLGRGRVRFMEAEPLFERAVQSLLTSADSLDKVPA